VISIAPFTEFYTPTNALLYTIKYLSKTFTLKHLKTIQHVSIIIQIIFRELVCFSLKSLILKFVKNVKVSVVMRQLKIWSVYVCSVWRCVPDCSPTYLFKYSTRTHTLCYAAASPHQLLIFLTNFKISDFNKEHTSSLKMIRMMIETCWIVLKCFNMNILD